MYKTVEKPQLVLKFGGIKGGDFTNSPEASEVFTEGKFSCITDEDHKENALKIIELYNGDFYEWWGSKILTKEQAKDYIKNYK